MAIFHRLRLGMVLSLALVSAAFAQEPAAPEPAAGEPRRLVVVGDSLGEGLARALAKALEDIENLEVERRARGSSGLVRDDFYDWPEAAGEIVAEGPVAAMVMVIGVNDRQTIQLETGRASPLGDEWRKEYISRIDRIINTFKAAGAKLYWVGLPPMPTSRVSSDMAAFNEIYRDRITAAGGKFIDIWDAFANDDGRFTPVGPDLTGSIRRLRASDGVHFTRAGYEKLAHFVEQEVRADLAPGTGGAEVAVPEDIPPAVPPAVVIGPPPEPADGPEGEDADRQRPGPVIPLNGTGSGEPTLIGGKPKETAERSVIEPKPGRADDFRWPQ